MMKAIWAALLLTSASAEAQSSFCTNLNAAMQVAREAVQALIGLSNSPIADSYYGAVENVYSGNTSITIQPHFRYSKDWYRVEIRNADCRVMNTALVAERLPIDQ